MAEISGSKYPNTANSENSRTVPSSASCERRATSASARARCTSARRRSNCYSNTKVESKSSAAHGARRPDRDPRRRRVRGCRRRAHVPTDRAHFRGGFSAHMQRHTLQVTARCIAPRHRCQKSSNGAPNLDPTTLELATAAPHSAAAQSTERRRSVLSSASPSPTCSMSARCVAPPTRRNKRKVHRNFGESAVTIECQ